MSTKAEATKPFAKIVCAIGGNYDLHNLRFIRCFTVKDEMERYMRRDVGIITLNPWEKCRMTYY